MVTPWAEKPTSPRRPSSRFQSDWPQTLLLLEDEVARIKGEPPIVIELGVDESDIRIDGSLRPGARPSFPGVRVSFTSRFGPVQFATDAYESNTRAGLSSWQANVRAIALTLGALRDMDRWGASQRGQQYAGWAAPPPRGQGTFPSAAAAGRWAT